MLVYRKHVESDIVGSGVYVDDLLATTSTTLIDIFYDRLQYLSFKNFGKYKSS